MTSLLISWLISSVAVFLTAQFLPGFTVRGIKGALLVAAVLGVLQAVLGGVLFVMLGIATLGLGFLFGFITRWLITTLLLMLADKLLDSFKVKSFGTAAVGALIMNAIIAFAEWVR